MAQNKILLCRDCDVRFIFSIFDQDLFYRMGYYHEPSRCPSCRALRRQSAPDRFPPEWREVEAELDADAPTDATRYKLPHSAE